MSKKTLPLDEIIPEWGKELHVAPETLGMAEALARIAKMQERHPEVSNPTATAIEREGQVLVLESGGQIHPSFCPRIALESASGTEYEFCPDHCHSENHAEARAARFARENKMNVAGGTAYLAGHYWACMPCWEALRSVGVTTLALVSDAEDRYKKNRGTLSPRQGVLPRPLRLVIEGSFSVDDQARLMAALRKVGFDIVTRQANPAPEVVLIAPGANPEESYSISGVLRVDTSKEADYRRALTLLSQETERLFGAEKR